MRTFLQPPIAALAAVCISVPAGVPVANAADAHAESGAAGLSGSATTIAQGSDFAADNSGLKLVFAEVGTDPQVGSGAARASGQKVELLALPASLAADVITNGTGAVSSTVLAAGRQAADDIVGDLNQASASPLVAAAPTPLDVLQLPLQTLWAIGAGVNVPVSPLIPTPYISLLKVVSDAIQVGLLPLTVLNLTLYGQIQKIPDTITKTINTSVASLQAFPASVIGTLQYDVSVLQQFFGGLGAPAAPAAPTIAAASSLAAAPTAAVAATPTLLDVLQLPLQTAWAIGAGVNVPVSPLVPTPYTSVLKVVSDAIQVAILPLTIANLALYGQIAKIPDTITKTINTAATSLFVGLPASIAGTLQYDVSVVLQFLGGLGAPAMMNAVAAPAAVSPQAKSAAVDPSPTLQEERKGAEIAAAADVTDSGSETEVTKTADDATAGGKTNTATADATTPGESKESSTDSTTNTTTTEATSGSTTTTGSTGSTATGTAGDSKTDTAGDEKNDTKSGASGSQAGDADGGTSTKADNTAK